jgi:transcriptional regulator with XRE-family HTH domain
MQEWRLAVLGGLDRYDRMALERRDRAERRLARQREVAHLVRALRDRAHLTQEELAYRMSRILGQKVYRSQVSMWEIPGRAGQMVSTDLFLALLEATTPEDRPETIEERQARVIRTRVSGLRLRRPPTDEESVERDRSSE